MSQSESAASSSAPEPVVPAGGAPTAGTRFWQILLILLALETGLFLTAVPWSSVWDDNLLTSYFPVLRPLLRSDYLRGAVSGLGFANLWVGVVEAREWIRPASEREPASHS
jgi:hypothetical protein